MAKLANAKHLILLSLYDCPLTKKDLVAISTIHSLEVLDLARSGIVDDDIVALGKLKGLRLINFSSCKLTPRCLSTLQEMQPKVLLISLAKWPAADKAALNAVLKHTRISIVGENVN